MTARSKAARLAAKRGRPKLAANLNTREPNGRKSRRSERTELLEHEMISTVAATRVRHLHLVGQDAIEKAANPRYGYTLGRIRMDGHITEEQFDAGQRYSEDMARYYVLTGVPFPSAKAQNMFAIKSDGGEPEGKAEAARKARAKMVELRDVLLKCGDINTGRRVIHTVNAVCVEDLDNLRHLNPPMLAWLKRGLNALAVFYSGR
jgi:hypothetical protein